ncbi:MAG: mechanosensitive ion channel [Methylicorpusculum sp.]|uniref:mechanosensitive ion channel family protein n=2 Tax=Methylicorpusculum sp. TaxID=2713644 RepID=UPI002722C1C2|nr:mechanosensitive ion channel domain-containing protein [Methylicorpusculum sp.]MDO8938702.1 mechanosensitive ion channel [Methylicorpusculum sp.]MDO9241659.1 mechanosensitive ion channel [Methylicorpusculum sp.]MDP2177303.1 mechanosensitive ion channel [Methylicorpusculum sp.]MDP2203222.1 mechanosensitive ion channel [Methylicorpusculum sp.]MDP3529413.1 mechanosensitive ion channel [Methylicorpusculum sp.]
MGNNKISDIFIEPDLGTFLEVLLIIFGALLLIQAIQKLFPWIANRLYGASRLFILAMIPLLRLILIITAFVLIIPRIIEPSLQNLIPLLGTLGIALGFAFKDFASSLIAGVVAVGERPYHNGDWIEINGIYGEVKHIGMRAVQLVTPDDTAAYIPHIKLWTEPILNANNGTPALQCVANFYLHPDHDAVRVKQLLHDVALTSPYLNFEEPIAVVVQDQPWGTHYRIRAYPIEPYQQFRFISDLTTRAKAGLKNLGIIFAVVPALPKNKDTR